MALSDTPETTTATPALQPERTPRAVLWGVGIALTALVGGALYLLAVRGDALMLDLQAIGRFFCG